MFAIQRSFTVFFFIHSSIAAAQKHVCAKVGEPTSPWSQGYSPMEESK